MLAPSAVAKIPNLGALCALDVAYSVELLQQLRTKAARAAVEKANVSREYIIMSLREVADRSMSAIPVVDKLRVPTGEYRFDSAGANRALELLGKELGMFVDRSESGHPGEFDRNVN